MMAASKSAPCVSVIMAVKDSARFLPETLASLEAQTLQDWELVAVDDGSCDGGIELIRNRLGSRAVIGFTEGGKGPAAARNHAIALSSGGYLAILDSDDLATPDRFEKQVGWLQGHPGSAACAAWAKTFGTGTPAVIGQSPGSLRAALIFRNPVVHSTLMVRRDALPADGHGYDERLRYAHDYQLIVELAFAGEVHILPEVLCRYRQHEAQITQSHAAAQREFAISIQRNLLQRFGIDPSDSDAAIHYRFGMGIGAESEKDMELTFAWAQRLVAANRMRKIVPCADFEHAVRELTARVCQTSCLPAASIVRCYLRHFQRQSPLSPVAFLTVMARRFVAKIEKRRAAAIRDDLRQAGHS